jgi:hypothetical protein
MGVPGANHSLANVEHLVDMRRSGYLASLLGRESSILDQSRPERNGVDPVRKTLVSKRSEIRSEYVVSPFSGGSMN